MAAAIWSCCTNSWPVSGAYPDASAARLAAKSFVYSITKLASFGFNPVRSLTVILCGMLYTMADCLAVSVPRGAHITKTAGCGVVSGSPCNASQSRWLGDFAMLDRCRGVIPQRLAMSCIFQPMDLAMNVNLVIGLLQAVGLFSDCVDN